MGCGAQGWRHASLHDRMSVPASSATGSLNPHTPSGLRPPSPASWGRDRAPPFEMCECHSLVGPGWGSRRTPMKARFALRSLRRCSGGSRKTGVNRIGAARPPTLARPRHRASGRTSVFRRALRASGRHVRLSTGQRASGKDARLSTGQRASGRTPVFRRALRASKRTPVFRWAKGGAGRSSRRSAPSRRRARGLRSSQRAPL